MRNTQSPFVLSWTDEIYATVHRLANMEGYQSLRALQSGVKVNRCIRDLSTPSRLRDRIRRAQVRIHAT